MERHSKSLADTGISELVLLGAIFSCRCFPLLRELQLSPYTSITVMTVQASGSDYLPQHFHHPALVDTFCGIMTQQVSWHQSKWQKLHLSNPRVFVHDYVGI